jgi:twitching motility protein PilT
MNGTLIGWVRQGKERGASDLLLESGTPPVLRVRGELVAVSDAPSSSESLMMGIARDLLDEAQGEEFSLRKSSDLSMTLAGTRCRINLFQTSRGVGMAIRLLSSFQNTLQDCNLHPDLKKLTLSRSGLVIVSGSTGSGKSTTLAALIEEMNSQQRKHIITLESPIEYFFSNRRSYIRQREIPTHSPSFEQAITDSMRENPDVLVIGEMRTPDVMRLTLNAAETGHLVLATMHSSTGAEALARVCMSFSAEIQGSIRAQLADCLVGVVCQKLDFLPQHQLRVPQCEILMANTSARSNIRSGQFAQLQTSIQTGAEDGMWSFERYQRWMEQKKDWVRPSQAAPLSADEGAKTTAAAERPRVRARPQTDLATEAVPSSLQQAGGRFAPRPTTSAPTSGESRIEISAIDEDLEDLARKLSK